MMFEIIKGALGLFVLLMSVDMIGRLIWKRQDGLAGRWLSWIVAYYSFIVPFFYLLNLFGLKIDYLSVLVVLGFIWLVTGVLTKNKLFEFSKPRAGILTFMFVAYLAIHTAFYSIYYTIPEWDSYSNITIVRNNVLSETLISDYRPLFNASMTLISTVTLCDPYLLFPVFLIILQSSLLVSIFLLTRNGNRVFGILLMVSALVIPVVNMEVDVPRPQSILLVLMPIYYYFLSHFLFSTKTIKGLSMLIWMSVVGLLYHEFFFSLLFVSLTISVVQLIKYWTFGSIKDKVIVILALLVAMLLMVVSYDNLFTFKYGVNTLINMFSGIFNHLSWNWWFLSNDQSADGMSTSWTGVMPVLLYYGYFVSPIIVGWIVYLFTRLFTEKKVNWFRICLIMVATILLVFAEILPRMGIGVLPDRIWLFFDLTILLLATNYISDKRVPKVLWFAYVILLLVSFLGSLIVANGRKSLTTSEEMKAAMWIRDNTPRNSVFISQQANSKMIEFFGERRLLLPSKEFFLSEKLVQLEKTMVCDLSKVNFEVEKTKNILLNFDILKGDVESLANNINATRVNIRTIKDTCNPTKIIDNDPAYVLYSTNKLEGIYSTRKWWQDVNYFGANLDKFEVLPLVYDYGGVKIWELN